MKKRIKRMISILMTMVMCLGLCFTSFASEYVITVENSIGGETYTAYKIFDATYGDEIASYTIESDSAWFELIQTGEDTPFTLTLSAGSSTTYVVTFEDADEATAWLAQQEVPEGATSAARQEGTGGSITLDVGAQGYYFIDTNIGATVTLTNVNPTATVVDKNQNPGEGGDGFNKDIVDKDGEVVSDTSYSVGDTIYYKITSYVPTYDGEDKVLSYTFTDEMGEGLTLDASSIKVIISGTGLSGEEEIESGNYTLSYENGVLTITYEIDAETNKPIENYPADAQITITYSANVNDAADDGGSLHNEVSMSWTVDNDEDPDREFDDTPDADAYTYGFDLKKTDGTDVLNGAEFTLQKQGSESIITFIIDEVTGTYEEWDGVTNGTTTTTITVGEANIWGLGTGTYILTETKAPDGYNMLTASKTITITATTNGWTVTDEAGTLLGTGTFDSTAEDGHGITADSIPVLTIVNQAGTALPGTGGIGTTIFYVVGTLLVLAAVALVVAKMRLGKTE